MRILIVEGDFVSRNTMLRFLSKYGECDISVNGQEAIDAFVIATAEGKSYALICLAVLIPILDGYQVLKRIREMENDLKVPEDKKVKIIMTTALIEKKYVKKAFELDCTAYAGKPINQKKFIKVLKKLNLL